MTTGARNVTQQLIDEHLVEGTRTPGEELGLRIDQTLTQDATGTMVMLELEAMGLERTRAQVSVQYVDHNLLQAGSRNAEDHEFLRSAARRFGLWFSKPGNGVSHPTHMQRFGVPGATMVGNTSMLEAPLPAEEARGVELVKGENVRELPDLPPLADTIEAPVLVAVGDDVSTDTIMPAGADALPYRSNIPALAEFAFRQVDEGYAAGARECRDDTGHVIVGGENYGQGSSREHAAIAPRHLGLQLVLARPYARIHWQNLVNFGVLPLELADTGASAPEVGDVLRLEDVRRQVAESPDALTLANLTQGTEVRARHRLSPRQVEVLLAGGLVPWLRERVQ